MSNEIVSRLDALKAKTPVKNTEIDTRPSAEVMAEAAIGNDDTKVIKAKFEAENSKENSTSDKKSADKSKRGRKSTRTETMKKFSFKVPKELSDTVKATLLRKGKKIQPVMTKMIEDWIANPKELNIDQAYLDIPARSMKSTGFFMEESLIQEFGAVATEQDTSMNLVVMHMHNEIIRGNF